MFREIINGVSFGVLITLMVGLFILISYSSAYFLGRFFHRKSEKAYYDLTNAFMSILTGGFFVLLAFIIITTWNYQQEAESAGSKEANYLATIVRSIAVFPPQEQRKIRDAVGAYTVAVRVNEWEAMRYGKESPLAWKTLDNLYTTIQNFQPVSSKEKLFYSLVIADMNGVLSARRERIIEIDSMIPKTLSYSIFTGAIFLAALLGVIRGHAPLINLAPMLLFSGLLGFNLAIAMSFDYPYSGDVTVSNKFYYSGVLQGFSDK